MLKRGTANSTIDIIHNNGLETRIQINTITVPYPHAKKLSLVQLERVAFLQAMKLVGYSWINYHLH